jgi:hypothetical protein
MTLKMNAYVCYRDKDSNTVKSHALSTTSDRA